jgi:hypothetical protein
LASATSASHSTTAAAASLIPAALPAVTEPFLSNTGRSLAMASTEASARMCSSVSNTVVPFRDLSSMGRICSLNQPSAVALAARWWLWTASASWSSREMPHLPATFSAVTPMWQSSKGSVRAPTIMSTAWVSPMRAPQRSAGSP